MEVTARELNRATLARQLLLHREAVGAADAVRRVVGLQAQQAASPYLALWNRVEGFDPAELDAAFATGEVVKATLMRITLHAVHADDYPTFRQAMEPTLRAARLGGRFQAAGLTLADAHAILPDLLAYAAGTRTGAEMEAWLAERLGATLAPDAWPGLRGWAPLLHAPAQATWTFGPTPRYTSPPAPPALGDPEVSAASLRTLVLRYLGGFGPASVADVAQFAMIQRARARTALRELSGDLERLEGPGGVELFDLPGAPRPDGDTPAPPRLLGMWDSILLAYADRSRVLPADHRKLVTRMNGDVLPTLLIDGHVAGVWRAVEGGIEATAFHSLTDESWDGLAAEARQLMAFLEGREPSVYRRYGHWWAKLPEAETRLLT